MGDPKVKVLILLPSPDYDTGERDGIEGVVGPFEDDAAVEAWVAETNKTRRIDCGRGRGCCWEIADLEDPKKS